MQYTAIFTSGIYDVWSLLQKNLGKNWIQYTWKKNGPKEKITEARWQVKGTHYTLLFSFVHTWNFKVLSLLMKNSYHLWIMCCSNKYLHEYTYNYNLVTYHNFLQTVWETDCWNAMKRSLGKVNILQGTSNTVTSSQRYISLW